MTSTICVELVLYVIVFQGHFLGSHGWLRGLDRKAIVVDLYDPFQLESLELDSGTSIFRIGFYDSGATVAAII